MRYLLFILFFLTQNSHAQTPCSGIDQQVEKTIRSGVTPKVGILKADFFAYKLCVQQTDTALFLKIKYFDFILKGDGSAYVAMLNDEYVILNKDYKVVKTVIPEKGKQSTGLMIFPFTHGFARVNATNEYVIATDGNPRPNVLGKVVYPTQKGFFIQDTSKVSHFVPLTGPKVTFGPGYLSTYWLDDQQFFSLVNKKVFSVFDETGKKRHAGAKMVFPVTDYPFVAIYMPNDNLHLENKSGKQIFNKPGVTNLQWGKYGLLYQQEKDQYYFSFASQKDYKLVDTIAYRPFQENLLLVTKGDSVGFSDLNGELQTTISYESGSDWNYNVLFSGESVFISSEGKLKPMACTRKQYNESIAFGKNYKLFQADKLKLVNKTSGDLFPWAFDVYAENWNGWNKLTDTIRNRSIVAHKYISKLLVYENGVFSVRDTLDLKKVIGPEMDTLIVQGFEPYRYQAITGKWGMVNSDLKVVCPAEFDKVSSLGVSRFKVSKSNKVGVANSEGKMLLPTEFDDVLSMQSHFYLAKKGSEVFVYDCYGTLLYEKGIKSAEIKFEDQQLKLFLLTADKQHQVKVIPYN